jgi:hypothetical protein
LKDEFSLFAGVLPPPFVYSDFFTFNGNLNPSGSTSYMRFAQGLTWENVNWRKPFLDGSHQLNDFHLPATINVKYALPLTYPVFRVRLDGTACSNAGILKLDGVKKVIPLTAKSASIKIPKDVSGQPTTGSLSGWESRGHTDNRLRSSTSWEAVARLTKLLTIVTGTRSYWASST